MHNERHLNIYKLLLMLIESCYVVKVVSVSADAIVLRGSDRELLAVHLDAVVASKFGKKKREFCA